jgi:hypothetical protein
MEKERLAGVQRFGLACCNCSKRRDPVEFSGSLCYGPLPVKRMVDRIPYLLKFNESFSISGAFFLLELDFAQPASYSHLTPFTSRSLGLSSFCVASSALASIS